MNVKNAKSNIVRFTTRAKGATLAGLTGVMMAPGFAFAQSGDFDGSEVIAKIVTYTAVGVSMVAAFILGRWTLKALGVIGGK